MLQIAFLGIVSIHNYAVLSLPVHATGIIRVLASLVSALKCRLLIALL